MNKRKYFTECLCASIFDEKVYHYDGYYVDGGITLECNLSDLKEDFKMDGCYDNIKEYAINELDFKDVKDVIDDVILQAKIKIRLSHILTRFLKMKIASTNYCLIS